MPIEIRELILRAVVGNASQESRKTKSEDDCCDETDEEKKQKQVGEAMEQFKQMMTDNKER